MKVGLKKKSWLQRDKIFGDCYWKSGYTLAEIMIVLAILSVFAVIIAPKIGTAIRSANEGATKGRLSAIRAALAIYYTDNEGLYPDSLDPLMQPGSKYLTRVVPLYTGEHGSNYNITYSTYVDSSADNGGWGYVNVTNTHQWGTIWVQCTHTDTKGIVWSTY